MVAIQALITLTMAVMAAAAPAGSINTNLRFFRIDDSSCDPGVQIDQVSVFNPPLTPGQTVAINTCQPHSAWGSVAIDNIQAGCVFQEFTDSNCASPAPGRPVGTVGGQCIQGLGLDAFYKVSC